MSAPDVLEPPRRISLVRHGEFVANVKGVWQGQGDAPLSPLGQLQAEALGARLRGVDFCWVESSDLSRALHTGQRLARPIHPNPAFREIALGRWEGLTRAEVAQRFPEEVRALRDGAPIQIGGGESWEDLFQRTSVALDAVKARVGPGQHGVVFSHGGVVTNLIAGVLGVRRRFPLPIGHVLNTSWTTLRFEGGATLLERYNDGSHHPSSRTWVNARFEPEDTLVTLLAYPAGAPVAAPLSTADAEHWLGEVSHVYATSPELEPSGQKLAHALGAAAVVDEGAAARALALGRVHQGTRLLVLATPESVRAAASQVLRDEAQGPHPSLALPAAYSLTHLVVSRHGVYLRDFAAGPSPLSPIS